MEKPAEKELVFNVPVRMRYYLEPLAILIAATAISILLIYFGNQLK
ncbi:hypothetical protein IT417_01770 [bacterium]|nr:hypothetical protein [bacterium]